ncbi:MAG: lasso peptide biosynthesis B2 protein [Bacteroidales bacterium]|nr:lasso peptide biosynthesis B2 protein [Bacteroidales bacterium]
MNKVKKYSSLNSLERRTYFKALFLFIWVRLILVILPFKKYATKLGEKDQETTDTLMPEWESYVVLVKDSIRRASRYNIVKPKCLAEAITAKKLLNKKQIPSTLYLGVAKDEKQKMIAHAWLRCGNIIVTGKQGMGKFTVVSKFA